MRKPSRWISALLLVLAGSASAAACKRESPEIASPDDEPKKQKPKPKKQPEKVAAEKHRATHEVCESKDTPAPTTATYAPRMPIPPGPACKSKADCKDGKGGRCAGGHCTYDNCYEDKDCPSNSPVCICQQEGSRGYFCKAGNCAVDSDCGADGYCSPSWSTECGAFMGTVGFYCHTKDDECTNDDECKKGKEQGYCAFDHAKKLWRCGYGHCVG